jgi:large subunit ribosomal protein L3
MLGKKIGMTSVYNSEGNLIPVTVVKADPCRIVGIRTKEKDGYNALQIGAGSRKEKNVNKPTLGLYKKKKLSPSYKVVEF